MRVLITGVSGQLGYSLAQACEKAGAEVFDIVQPQAGVHLIGGTEKELPFVHVVDGDQCDVRSLLRIKEEVKPDVVFALGALSVPAYASYLSAVTKFPRTSTATGPVIIVVIIRLVNLYLITAEHRGITCCDLDPIPLDGHRDNRRIIDPLPMPHPTQHESLG